MPTDVSRGPSSPPVPCPGIWVAPDDACTGRRTNWETTRPCFRPGGERDQQHRAARSALDVRFIDIGGGRHRNRGSAPPDCQITDAQSGINLAAGNLL